MLPIMVAQHPAPPASLRPFARQRLLPSFLLYDTFDNADLIKNYPGPTLVLHGRQDAIMPISHGQQVAAAPQGRLVVLEADHNDLLDAEGFCPSVAAFLRSAGVVAGGVVP